jgi:DNA-directed RNA polymerase subunit RPC12/RpoP
VISKEQLAAFLNLDNWVEDKFITSVESIVCPTCGARINRRPDDETYFVTNESYCGLWTCSHCQRQFDLAIVDSPLGKAWQTKARKA